jgi:hypothetical protein
LETLSIVDNSSLRLELPTAPENTRNLAQVGAIVLSSTGGYLICNFERHENDISLAYISLSNWGIHGTPQGQVSAVIEGWRLLSRENDSVLDREIYVFPRPR